MYVCGIIAWADMAIICFINDSLVSSSSPVLLDPVVSQKICALATAYEAINNSIRPQFFSIFADYAEQRLLERNNFPILSAVAMQVRSVPYHATEQTIEQFAGTTLQEDETVKRLVAQHRHYVNMQSIT